MTDNDFYGMLSRVRTKISGIKDDIEFLIFHSNKKQFDYEIKSSLLNPTLISRLLTEFFRTDEKAPNLQFIAMLMKNIEEALLSNPNCTEVFQISPNINYKGKKEKGYGKLEDY